MPDPIETERLRVLKQIRTTLVVLTVVVVVFGVAWGGRDMLSNVYGAIRALDHLLAPGNAGAGCVLVGVVFVILFFGILLTKLANDRDDPPAGGTSGDRQ